MGLKTHEINEMTLKEYFLYADAWQEKRKNDMYVDDMRTARICAMIANVNRDPKKRAKAYTENDFMPQYKSKERRKMSVEQMASMLKMITTTLGGDVHGD